MRYKWGLKGMPMGGYNTYTTTQSPINKQQQLLNTLLMTTASRSRQHPSRSYGDAALRSQVGPHASCRYERGVDMSGTSLSLVGKPPSEIGKKLRTASVPARSSGLHPCQRHVGHKPLFGWEATE